MGFDISWIAVEGRAMAGLLEKVGVRDTGEEDPACESPFCGADLPTGWFILFVNDSEFVSPKRLASLSADCRLVACHVHEGIMMSGASCYENGREIWSVTHDPAKAHRDLSVSGSPPPDFTSIRDRLTQEQVDEPKKRWFLPVDYIFDIPVETARSACGYRHDHGPYDWGEPRFTRLESL